MTERLVHGVFERLVHGLSYSPVGALRRIFSGGSPLALEADPNVQERIIVDVERRLYGAEGLEVYERRETRSLHRAARRSLAQHLAQRAQYSTLGLRVARIASFAVLTPFLIAFGLLESLRKRRPKPVPADVTVFYWAQRFDKFVWEGMFPGWQHALHKTQEMYLGFEELWFMVRAVRAAPRMLLYPDLVSNLFRWVSYYGFVRRRFTPRMVAHFFESTASCSLMTEYLHEHGIRHCDIQHGELRFSASTAFANFDEMRLWGEHFKDLLGRQRIPQECMHVVSPPFHRHLFEHVRPRQQPRPKRLLIIDAFLVDQVDPDEPTLRFLRALDGEWEVRLRRHPADRAPEMTNMHRWNSDRELRRRNIRVEEEAPGELPIADAIGRSRVVAGVSSAALLEAWLAGCKVLYLPGGPSRDVVMERHGASPNVCHLDDDPDLGRFFAEPACLDDTEAHRVNHVFAVLPAS